MNLSKTGRTVLIVIAVAVLLCLPGCNRTRQGTLELYSRESGQVLCEWPVQAGDSVQIQFIMSLYKVLQWEVYTITDDWNIYIEKVVFETYDAANYYDIECGFYQREDGMYEEIVDELREEILFCMGFKANHAIIVNGESRYIADLTHPGEKLTLRISH